jgi:hypothetical protein
VSAAASVAIGTSPDARDEPLRVAQALRAYAPLLAAALVCAVAASLVAPYPVGLFHDDGVYLVLAKSIATGSGYRYLHLPGAPVATHYPPAYPLLLAVLWTLAPRFPANLTIILLANAALLGLVAWGSARFLISRLEWPPFAATAFALVATLSLPLIQLTTLVLSEITFLGMLFLVLTSAERCVASRGSHLQDVLLGAGAGGLVLVRAHGVVLVAALALVLVSRREWRRVGLCVAGAAMVIAPWQLWVTIHDAALPATLRGSYGSYTSWFATGLADGGLMFAGQTIARNASEAAAILADRFAPWHPGMLRLIPLTFALALLALGIIRLWRRTPVTVAFLLAYVAVTLIWPYTPWRFIWGIWPFVLLLAVEGGATIVRWHPAQRPMQVVRRCLFPVLALLGLGLARAEVVAYRDRAWASPIRDATRSIAPAMRWISQNTDPHETVIADAEPLVYLFTARPSMPPVAFTAAEYVRPRDPAADVAALAELVRQFPVRYVVTVVPSTIAAARALEHPASPRTIALREVDAVPGVAVFSVIRLGPSGSEPRR